MEKKWISYLNLGLAAGCILLVVLALVFYAFKPSVSDDFEPSVLNKTDLKNPFKQPKDAHDAIHTSIFKLKQNPYTLQLPDLRKVLNFYGKNDRPDASDGGNSLHFGFAGNKNLYSVKPNEKRYIYYDRSTKPAQYTFSHSNIPTPLWIETEAFDKEARVKVRMLSETNEIIETPWAYAQFSIMQKDFIRSGTPWEIGRWRVDGSLLARQKAKWFGADRFIENHGGDDYSEQKSKQRIDFGEADDLYSVFVGISDILIFENDRWKVVKPSFDSQNYPILVIKKIDERLMQLELWDVNGRSKIVLNLLKSQEPWNPQNLLQNFKFMGSRTRSQFVFEINKERMLLSPQDWLLLTQKGWKKLTTAKDIDNYVARKTPGVMFIFEGIERKNDQQFIKGLLYNSSRTDVKNVELPISTSKVLSKLKNPVIDKLSSIEDTSCNEDDDDDDDDDDDSSDDEDSAFKHLNNLPIPNNIPLNTTHPIIIDSQRS